MQAVSPHIGFVQLIVIEDKTNIRLSVTKAPDKKGVLRYQYDVVRAIGEGNEASTPVPMPYWGRIVESSQAASLSKSVCLPLYPSDPDSFPTMYIDGSPFQNLERSESCIAWLIKPLPKPKEDKQEEDSHEQDNFKRRKKALQEEERKSKLPVPTHYVTYNTKFTVSVFINNAQVDVEYTRPTLVEMKTNTDKTKLFRKLFDWDDVALDKPSSSKPSKVTNFALM